jgi:hypothetical protein
MKGMLIERTVMADTMDHCGPDGDLRVQQIVIPKLGNLVITPRLEGIFVTNDFNPGANDHRVVAEEIEVPLHIVIAASGFFHAKENLDLCRDDALRLIGLM